MKKTMLLLFLLLVISLVACNDDDSETKTDGDMDTLTEQDSQAENEEEGSSLPHELAVEYSRPDVGEALTNDEITAFTKKLMKFLDKVDYFRYVWRVSHGVDKSTGKPDWMTWWDGTEAVKSGDTVTFRHVPGGGGHNIFIPTSKLLTEAVAAYLMTGDDAAGLVLEQFSKGQAAACKCMEFGENDPYKYTMARNFVAQNHAFEIDGGRKKAVDFTGWYSSYSDWNTGRYENANNPYWGDIWFTNMRSKDDVCHIFRTAAFVRYAAEEAKDETIRNAAKEAYEYVSGFSKDIVDNGYLTRTKDKDGNPYFPKEDLASFVAWDFIFKKSVECTAKISAAFLAYGEPKDNNCGLGTYNSYEINATNANYYELAIFRNFHMSATALALVHGYNDMAQKLIEGLADRADIDQNPEKRHPQAEKQNSWEGDLAVFLLQSSSVGLPLTSREVRLIHQYYSKAVDNFSTWTYWDLWDSSIPDGTYDYRPSGGDSYVDISELAMAVEYCFSPFKNPAGKIPVDCEIVKDRTKWGD